MVYQELREPLVYLAYLVLTAQSVLLVLEDHRVHKDL